MHATTHQQAPGAGQRSGGYPEPGLLHALARRRRMIGALLLRESQTRFGRTRIGYLWALVEPISHVAVMSLVYWAINRQAPVGASVIMFFATGVLPFLLFHRMALQLGAAVRGSQKVLRLPFVAPIDILVARAILEGLTWVAVTTIVFTALVAMELAEPPDQPFVVAAAALATFGLGAGIGLVNATTMTLWASSVHTYRALTRPLYIFSAIFFSIDQVPSYLQYWLSWNPVLHAVLWFRAGFRADYASHVLDETYLLGWVVGSLFLGLCLLRVARTRLPYA